MVNPKIRIEADSRMMSADNGILRIECDLIGGLLALHWQNGESLSGLFGEVAFGAERLRTSWFTEHQVPDASIQSVEDGFGQGIRWTFEHRQAGNPVIRQHLWMYEGLPYVLVELEAEHVEEWETNHLAPLVALSNDEPVMRFGAGASRNIRALFVPYDNDKWVRFASHAIPSTVESYEVTAVYDSESRNGFVLGSITHDFWKTGIQVEGAMPGEVTRLRVVGGVTGLHTRDTLPHGSAHGKVNVSPRIFVGAFDDYRDGLESYGRANAVMAPKLPWDHGVPFGWNSWAAVMGKLDLDVYVHTSDFIRRELQEEGFTSDGGVYINFDAFWNSLSGEQLQEAVNRVRANGQKPGIYFTPFAYWGKDPERPVEGYEGRYVYRDLLLKDQSGNLLPTIAGAYALDPSHPVTLERIKRQLEQFVEWGFEYAKADFLCHGALEGRHHDPNIRSGIQAYNLGMAMIQDTVSPEKIGKPFFLNLSIAPLFPHGYAHSRRVSCDVFGLAGDTEYLLNAITYGWWINDTLYRFNDPDHTVLFQSCNQRESTPNEGRGRLTASILAGTSMLLGDDFRKEGAASRAVDWLTRPEIMDLARKGISFRPVEGSSGDRAESVFVLHGNGEHWIAVFNLDPGDAEDKRLNLQRLGFPAASHLSIRDMWDGGDVGYDESSQEIKVRLKPDEAKLLHVKF
ncbi:alpha-galactosidase [Cohnella candidum]|uniref:Alpha-galactosidase n=1 Tax=Cohnella candidum TaxID=2674991 RepID=A0A3G3JSC9_9BACL|nr:alpha-galactosidase [Cohnella candidum]AYQ71136.1 alpha-galactosidase [Cohnella candidum]